MTTMTVRFLAAALLAGAAASSHAFNLRPDGVSVQGGVGSDSAALAGVSVVWDWDFEKRRRKATLSAHTDLMLNHWRTDAPGGGRQALTQVVLLPTLRMRLSRGESPWFIEIGIGASWMDSLLVTPDKRFSTQWNFYDTLGFGYSLGADREHELGLRWVHVSNLGIKEPNPGQDFVLLRYVRRF